MSRRQLPRHKKQSRTNKPVSKPAAQAAQSAQPAPQPTPSPAPPGLEDPEVLRARVRALATQIREDNRAALRRLLRGWSTLQSLAGASVEDSLLRMLRSQIFNNGTERCHREDIVQIRQPPLGEPLDPVTHPRSQLMCPLHEAALDGRLSPCPLHKHKEARGRLMENGIATILRAGRRAAGQAVSRASLKSAFALLDDNDEDGVPCVAILHERAVHEVVFGPGGSFRDAVQDPQALLVLRARLLSADQAHLRADDLRAQLQFLHDSGRLTSGEAEEILLRGHYATDLEWLSCWDDGDRTQFSGCDDSYDDRSRTICPLQHRALLGDRTVPCAQALEQKQDRVLAEEVRGAPPPRDRPQGELPRSWSAPEEGPGQEGDIVRRLHILPCHAMGRLLAMELPAVMARLRDEGGPERKETSGSAVEVDWEGSLA